MAIQHRTRALAEGTYSWAMLGTWQEEDGVEPMLWRPSANLGGSWCATGSVGRWSIGNSKQGRTCAPPWPPNERSWRLRDGGQIQFPRTARSSLPIARMIAFAYRSNVTSQARPAPPIGRTVDSHLRINSMETRPSGLPSFEASPGRQFHSETPMLVCRRCIGSAIVVIAGDALKVICYGKPRPEG